MAAETIIATLHFRVAAKAYRAARAKGVPMADTTSQPGSGQGGGRPVRPPVMQRVLDNPFLLLFLGVVVPTVFYLIWGIIEVTQIPIAK